MIRKARIVLILMSVLQAEIAYLAGAARSVTPLLNPDVSGMLQDWKGFPEILQTLPPYCHQAGIRNHQSFHKTGGRSCMALASSQDV
jgi:hypothetical protein